MSESGQHRRPDLKVLKGGGRGEERALRRLLGQGWLLKAGALFGVLAALAFMVIPAFSRRAPRLTAEEVAAAMASTEGLGPVIAGLVEVLELDQAQAQALQRTLEQFEERARGPRQAREAALGVLRGAAAGSGAEAAAVDLALVKRRDAQAKLEALDAELVEAVSVGLSPSQKARAAIVLGHFLQRGGSEGHAVQASTTPAPAPAAAVAPPAAPATTAPAARP